MAEFDCVHLLNGIKKLATPPPNADINQLRDILRDALRELRGLYKMLELRIFITMIMRPNIKIGGFEVLLQDIRPLIKTPILDQKKEIIQHLSEIRQLCDIN